MIFLKLSFDPDFEVSFDGIPNLKHKLIFIDEVLVVVANSRFL